MATERKKAASDKPVRKASKARRTKITDEMFEAWLLKKTHKQFIQIAREWNERKLKVVLKKQDSYDGWLNYFKTLPPNTIRVLAETGLDVLPTEGYAALRRWADIINNPGRIDKIHRAGLTSGKSEKNIVDYAKENNRMGVLEALRDELASKLQQGAGARDAGTLAAQLTEIMTQIEVYKKRLGPKEETILGSLLTDMPTKRPGHNGGGHRHTSFASRVPRVTIEDLETVND